MTQIVNELRKPAFKCPAKPVDLATLESELLKLAAESWSA
jgi:hypothetical protein